MTYVPNMIHIFPNKVLHLPGSRAFERKPKNPKKDVDSLKDLEKDVGDQEDSLGTIHSHVSLKEGKEG